MSRLSNKEQLGPVVATESGEPVYVLRASNPFSAMVLRFMANAAQAIGIPLKERDRIIATAIAIDKWRERNSAGG